MTAPVSFFRGGAASIPVLHPPPGPGVRIFRIDDGTDIGAGAAAILPPLTGPVALFAGRPDPKRFRLNPAAVRRDFERRKAEMEAKGIRPEPRKFSPDLDIPIPRLLRCYLKPFRLSAMRLALLLGLSPHTLYGYLYGKTTMPADLFVKLLNILRVEDPSWLFFALSRDELRRYFRPQVLPSGRIILHTLPGRPPRPVDIESLQRVGLPGLIREARVRRRMNLVHAENLSEDQLAEYESGRSLPNTPQNRHILDLLIENLALSPSEAYIGSGRPWVTRFIEVHDGCHDSGADRGPIAPVASFPYEEIGEVSYRPLPVLKSSFRQKGSGFGGFIRQARTLSGLSLGEAASRLKKNWQSLKEYELYGIRPPFEILRKMAELYGEAIRTLCGRSSDPLEELILRYNRHYHPSVARALAESREKQVFLAEKSDAAAVRSVLRLPPGDFRRRLVLRRLELGFSMKKAAEEWGVDVRVVRRLEDPEDRMIPPFDLLCRIAGTDDRASDALALWRKAVRDTFYSEVPWEFLEEEGIYLSSDHDVKRLLEFVLRGKILREDLGWNLFRWRTAMPRCWSLNEASFRLGLSLDSLRGYEKGVYRPTDSVLARLAKKTEIDIDHWEYLRGMTCGRSADPGLRHRLTNEERPRYIRRHVRKAVPAEWDGDFLARGRTYRVVEFTNGIAEDREQVFRILFNTILDTVSVYPWAVFTTTLSLSEDERKSLREALAHRLEKLRLREGQVIFVAGGFQFQFMAKGGRIATALPDPEDPMEGETAAEDEVNRFLDRLHGEESGPYFPEIPEILGAALERSGMGEVKLAERLGESPQWVRRLVGGKIPRLDPATFLKVAKALPLLNRRLLAQRMYPEIEEWFPHALSEGIIEMSWEELFRAFETDLSRFPPLLTGSAVRSAARFLGLPPEILMLRVFYPHLLFVFALHDPEIRFNAAVRPGDPEAIVRRIMRQNGFLPFRKIPNHHRVAPETPERRYIKKGP